MLFDKKVDFAVLVSVTNANPNGDPLNGKCSFGGVVS